jgi:hypothetical protein
MARHVETKEIVEAGKELNESGLITKIKLVGVTAEDLRQNFCKAIESIPETDESETELLEKAPKAVEIYTALVAEIEDGGEEDEGEEKKAPSPSKGAKKEEKVKEKVKEEKVKKEKKAKAPKVPMESNIEVMKKLLGEKKSAEEILKAFIGRYPGKDKEFVEKRVKIYTNIAKK